MNKENLKKEIIYQIDKELSYEPNGSGFSLIEDFTINNKDWHREQISKEDLDIALNELIAESEIVMGNGPCGPTTLVISSYKPGTAIQMLKAEGKRIPEKVQNYYNKLYSLRGQNDITY